jgi:hypothetical protein
LRGQGGHGSFPKNTDPKSLKKWGSYQEKNRLIISISVKLTLASKSVFSKEGK